MEGNFFVLTDKELRLKTIDSDIDAKLAIKELKILKKEKGIEKKSILSRQKGIRAMYTDSVRSRGSMVRGGGGIGKFVRGIQRASRDSEKRALATALAPLEKEKQYIEILVIAIDKTILKIETTFNL